MTNKADKTLTLLRHAKSSWTNAHLSDHERPLNDRGKRDAPEMASRLLDRSCIPDMIYSSSAARALETAAIVAETMRIQDTHIKVFDKLYLATAECIMAVVMQAENTAIEHLMVIGHNPGMETLGSYLSNEAMAQLPTAGVYHFGCQGFDLVRPPNAGATSSDSPASLSKGNMDTHKLVRQGVELLFQDFPKNR